MFIIFSYSLRLLLWFVQISFAELVLQIILNLIIKFIQNFENLKKVKKQVFWGYFFRYIALRWRSGKNWRIIFLNFWKLQHTSNFLTFWVKNYFKKVIKSVHRYLKWNVDYIYQTRILWNFFYNFFSTNILFL